MKHANTSQSFDQFVPCVLHVDQEILGHVELHGTQQRRGWGRALIEEPGRDGQQREEARRREAHELRANGESREGHSARAGIDAGVVARAGFVASLPLDEAVGVLRRVLHRHRDGGQCIDHLKIHFNEDDSIALQKLFYLLPILKRASCETNYVRPTTECCTCGSRLLHNFCVSIGTTLHYKQEFQSIFLKHSELPLWTLWEPRKRKY